MALWHSPPGQELLYGSLSVHATIALIFVSAGELLASFETPRPARETSATQKVRWGNATKRKSAAPKAFGAEF